MDPSLGVHNHIPNKIPLSSNFDWKDRMFIKEIYTEISKWITHPIFTILSMNLEWFKTRCVSHLFHIPIRSTKRLPKKNSDLASQLLNLETTFILYLFVKIKNI